MRKPTALYSFALVIVTLILAGCNEDHNNPDEPNLKSISMSYGDFQYRVLHYDEHDRIVKVVNGLIDDEQDSVETSFQVTYSGSNIQRIVARDNSQVFRYIYEGGRMVESQEYANGQVVTMHSFLYNAAGQVEAWITRKVDGEETEPVTRKFYTYDAAGNANSMELENYDPVTKGHVFISISRFMDFDDKKNTSSLFLNFYNPYHVPFKNNARVWRVENSNGSVGETRYEYEYNANDYTTSQRDVGGEQEILYHFNLP